MHSPCVKPVPSHYHLSVACLSSPYPRTNTRITRVRKSLGVVSTGGRMALCRQRH